MIMPCYPQMMRMALRFFSGDREKASDAVQDVLSALWEKRHSIFTTDDVLGLCLVSVRNRCISIYRKDRERLRLDEIGSDVSDVLSEPCTGSEADDVRSAIERLGEPGSVIVMMSAKGFNCREISAELGLTEANCRQILSRSRKKLRELLS